MKNPLSSHASTTIDADDSSACAMQAGTDNRDIAASGTMPLELDAEELLCGPGTGSNGWSGDGSGGGPGKASLELLATMAPSMDLE
jgi:hypothetical protein